MKIEVAGDEIDALRKECEQIVAFIAKIQEVDTNQVKPMVSPSWDMLNAPMRADILSQELTSNLLPHAATNRDALYVAPKEKQGGKH